MPLILSEMQLLKTLNEDGDWAGDCWLDEGIDSANLGVFTWISFRTYLSKFSSSKHADYSPISSVDY
jgi:hypothetical protein